MFERKPRQSERPVLLDRIVKSGSQRVAILGLHPRAGTRTVLVSLVRELHRRAWPFAVTSAARLLLEGDANAEPVTRIAIPEGAYIATSTGAAANGDVGLELQVATEWDAPMGKVAIYKVVRGGQVDLQGPAESEGMEEIVHRLGELSGGTVFVDGGWERRAFAAPGTSDGIVLVVAAAYSATPERSAAAARYLVETLTVPPCGEPARVAWEETASQGAAALLDGEGHAVGVLPPGLEDPVPALRALAGAPVSTVVLPFGLNDEFMVPLVRSNLRCTIVVRDATRINVAPIYFKAWLKRNGRIQVVRPVRLVAVASNPVNPAGPDADPLEFRQILAAALPDLPVHDVVVESGEEARRAVWRFWE